MSNLVELREGMCRTGPAEPGSQGGPALLGAKCASCGEVRFPATPLCPECLSADSAEADLGATATLFAFTIVHMKSVHFDPPYAVGYVDVPAGPRVFTPLVIDEAKPFEVGMAMTLEVLPMWEEDGAEIVAYRFKPS